MIWCQDIRSNKQKVESHLKKASEMMYDDWEEAKKNISQADEISAKSDDNELRNSFYKAAANLYYNRDIFDIALRYNLEAYEYYKENNKVKASEIENLIAIINARMNNKKEALKHFENIYHFNRNIKNYDLAAKALNNIGTIYLHSNKIDSAINYYQKAIQNSINTQEVPIKVISHTNYAEALAAKNENVEAEKEFKYVESLLSKSNDPYLLTNFYTAFSNFYREINKNEFAIEYAEKARDNSKIKYSFQNRDVLQALYKAYYSKGDYKKSSTYFQEYDNVRDSLNIEEKAVNIEKGKIEAEFKNKEQKLELENSKSRLKLLSVILILIVLISALAFVLLRYKNNLVKEKLEKDLSISRTNELNLDLEIRNKELVSKTMLENKKTELYQELIDEIKEKLKSEDIDELKKELNNIIFRLSKNSQRGSMDEFNLRFNNVYNSFYESLMEKHPDLSQTEKKLCAFIKLNLSSKDIADITKTSIKSVENSRTRLRKKLGLTNTNMELHKYISEI
ncbi:tetratricopeptide repeat protein [Epilithonimonas mollis]|nr:tetratricopeptide repeat protein [Epilithonimonas mollis]